ncbi:MAG TPA: SURF1 family protein [Candidatus Brachybacterium merdigallinarum]|nr:SURF1 family protein [Candidatus Brachybacterium merdigallinarum]
MNRSTVRRRVLLSRETLLGALVVILASALCIGLGLWQFGRYEDRRDSAAIVDAQYDADPVPLDEVLDSPTTPLASQQQWTPVTLTGSYCDEPACVLHVRNRQLNGSVGFWETVPFRSDDGVVLFVVRGWVAEDESTSAPAKPAALPEGEITITVRLRPIEPVLDRDPPARQAHSVNPEQMAELITGAGSDATAGTLVTGAFGELAAEQPPGPRPAPLEAPDTSLGPHLSYAFQWWIFALFFPLALVVRTRKVLQESLEDLEAEHETVETELTAVRRPRREVHTSHRGQDEDEEDALIDSFYR